MQKLYCFTEEEISEIRKLIGIANHDSAVINQNINNPECIKEYTENIRVSAQKALNFLDGK